MSHFYGSLRGSRGEATRQGTRSSGLTSHARGWHLGIRADMCTRTDGAPDSMSDHVAVYLTSGSGADLGARHLATFGRTATGWNITSNLTPEESAAWRVIFRARGIPE